MNAYGLRRLLAVTVASNEEEIMFAERLQRQEIFHLLRPEQVNLLSEASKVAKFKAGEVIYRQGEKADRFYIVLKGQVSLRLPAKTAGLSLLIDELTEGDMFGASVFAALDAYNLNAQCIEESEILVISASALRAIMDEDPRIGYVIQARISEIYFKRYVEAMEKLQAVVMNIPLELA
ncbi:MAG: cyclic nucleotide-binding domain-containing protein [Isosphaeraceae bacterium]